VRVTDARWGSAPPWAIGVEEELLLLEPDSLAPGTGAAELVAGRAPRLKTELFECVLETTTEVCATADEALEQLQSLRAEVTARAAARGLVVAASGSHPFAIPEEQPIVREERYARMVEELGAAARAQLVCGLHVHVSMPDAETCLRALEGVLPQLPALLSLGANSPYLAGAETGAQSSRAGVLLRLPYAGAPPHFPSLASWEAYVASTGRDYTQLWWDIRPHPRLGTLEVRMPDQQTDVRRSAAFAGVIQALVARAAEQEHDPYDRDVYARERELAAQGLLPHGGLDAPPLLAAPEAERQLDVGRSGDLRAVCADLVARSVA
jgi:carboxylate-amine ligase